MKGEEKRAKQEAAGIPDSKIFRSEEAVPTGETRILACHINGVLVSELNLPGEVIAALDYHATDEGIQEHNARPDVREPSGITLGRDDYSKACDQRRYEVKNRNFPDYKARNPLKELADKYTAPGMKPKFLSADCIQDGGTGDYEIVKYPAGDPKQGEPVKAKGMVLGQMPIELAAARNAHFRERGNQLLRQIEQKHKADGGLTDQ